jgi:glycosyltransferase involved in cell wall biosynthesis
MSQNGDKIRVLYSFPHKLGADRICYTAWQQVNGLAEAGADLMVHPGVLQRPVPDGVAVRPTLARGKVRIPYKVLGTMRACALHDHIVARRLRNLRGKVDIVHTWALGALETLKTAAEMGIPTVLERPNAHTRFAYAVVQKECDRIGVPLPADHEHAFKQDVLQKEEEEYKAAYRLLCPSEFTKQTFLDQGFAPEQLVRHIYGYDEKVYFPAQTQRIGNAGITALFVGVCAVRKGLHFALEAWLRSPACKDGTFLIAGEFLPAYKTKLAPMLAHPSVKALGHRNDVPELMRNSDVMILPTIEEGFGLVCTEAMGSGCVPVVSEACTDICRHMENALVHRVGDVEALTAHINMLDADRKLLAQLRGGALETAPQVTWNAAGRMLLDAYRGILSGKQVAPPVLQASIV